MQLSSVRQCIKAASFCLPVCRFWNVFSVDDYPFGVDFSACDVVAQHNGQKQVTVRVLSSKICLASLYSVAISLRLVSTPAS